MEKGRIVFLNGVTSSGKTSIVDAIQSKSEDFFYVVANDLFEQMIGDKYLQEDYWKYLSEVIVMMYHTARLFSDCGKNILIDGVLVEKPEIRPHYEKVKEIFKGYPLDIVEVFCPLEICRKRNIERGDRAENQSDWQNKMMAENIQYSCSVDTSLNTPDECAEIIIGTLFNKPVK
ncbi:chloramphenicol phosphotransferase CPT family protein [Paenibacillus spongiae]|uniref:Chloramphenicol phosphotransferase CPT family protein n=1 Tax=Paenibacillus spongiae TaxID=2909671 RepID=A0ABY5SHH2_9BACL|nr:chloramphenicol phosphotransferase CPT family protein [Paenibacillus spongiae]UVI33104.1 chloramphenicol phosphotransferase CPT family protein [Paenibacillus spongiae]